jgi:hypothetical protein
MNFIELLEKAGDKARVFPLAPCVKAVKADRVKKYKTKPDKVIPGEITFAHYLGGDTREFNKYVWAIVKIDRETFEQVHRERQEADRSV